MTETSPQANPPHHIKPAHAPAELPDRRNQLLPFAHPQPEPLECQFNYREEPGTGVTWTNLARLWRPGDPERCRLCPEHECSARGGVICLVSISRFVSEPELALFSRVAEDRRVGRVRRGGA